MKQVIMRQPRYSKEEFARLGNEIYTRDVRPKLASGSAGKIVAIDIESRDFALADDRPTASDALLARRPGAQIWFVRVGYSGVHRFGPRAAVTRT